MRSKRKEKSKNTKKGIWSFKSGLQTLTNAIEKKFAGQDKVREVEIINITKQDDIFIVQTTADTYHCHSLALASPPSASSKLLENISKTASNILSSIPLAPICVAHVSSSEASKIPAGWNAYSRSEKIRDSGVLLVLKLLNSGSFDKNELMTVFIGGMLNQKFINKEKEEIETVITKDLKTLLNLDANKLKFIKLTKWFNCIPQLTEGQ